MSSTERSAVKSLLSMHRTYAELDEYLATQLRDAGFAGVDIQKNPVGTRITVFVTRPGLAIGRRGTGIKDLTDRVAQKFNLPNPQIAVSEVESPELNPRIMGTRVTQIVSRGTAFRRAAQITMNGIMAAGAAGVEIGIAGKLRSDRSHKEKYRMGVVPKSGESAERVVREATTDVLLKLGLYGIKVKIAVKDALPPVVEYIEQKKEAEGEPKKEEKAPEASPKHPKKEQQPKPQPHEEKPQEESAKPETPAREEKSAEGAQEEEKVEQVATSENKDTKGAGPGAA